MMESLHKTFEPIISKQKKEETDSMSTFKEFDSVAENVGSQEQGMQTTLSLMAPKPEFSERSFFCCYQNTPIRKLAMSMVKSSFFNHFTLFVIILNCFIMTLYKHCWDEEAYCQNNWKCQFSRLSDHFFFLYFFSEMVIKAVGMGFSGRLGYLSNKWNRVDCLIVCASFMEYMVKVSLSKGMLQFETLKILQFVRRFLRPLRIINNVSSLRIIADMILNTVPMLTNVSILCLLIFFIFGVIAVQLWAGLLRSRCTVSNQTIADIIQSIGMSQYYMDSGKEYICSSSEYDGMHLCHEDFFRKSAWNDSAVCDESFDIFGEVNNGSSSTCVNWNKYYDNCTITYDNPFMGALSFDNIFRASLTTFVVITMSGWTDVMYYVQDAYSFWAWIYFVILIVIGSLVAVNLFLAVLTNQFSINKAKDLRKQNKEQAKRNRQYDADSIASYEDESEIETSAYSFVLHSIVRIIRLGYNQIFLRFFRKEKFIAYKSRSGEKVEIRMMHGRGTLSQENKDQLLAVDGMHSAIKCKVKRMHMQGTRWGRFRLACMNVVTNAKFGMVVMVAIVLNMIALSVEYHKQPYRMEVLTETLNYIFTAIFVVEMVMKLIGLGLYCYFKDAFNFFDAVIVISSLIEIFQTGSGSFSVLRAFRILRLVKLLRFIPSLERLFSLLVSNIGEISVFLWLLCIIIFIYSLIGTLMFGESLCIKPEGNGTCDCFDLRDPDVQCICSRTNFDTFFSSSLTVFQVLTTENWSSILVKCMLLVSEMKSVIYFVSLIVIGNYIVINLIIAVLVQAVMDIGYNERYNQKETFFSPQTLRHKEQHSLSSGSQSFISVSITEKPVLMSEKTENANSTDASVHLFTSKDCPMDDGNESFVTVRPVQSEVLEHRGINSPFSEIQRNIYDPIVSENVV